MARPRKKDEDKLSRLTFGLPAEWIKTIEAQAARETIPVSTLIRQLVQRHVIEKPTR